MSWRCQKLADHTLTIAAINADGNLDHWGEKEES